MSLADVLAPAIQLADGYPIEASLADGIEKEKARIKQWPYSAKLFLTHPGGPREAPSPGEIFRQPDLHATLTKLVEAERRSKAAGKSRKDAILAAYDRFYKGDIAEEFVRGSREQGGLVTMEDLAGWKPRFEEPAMTTYRGIDVYKLDVWTQGPAMLQALNILEGMDLKSMGYNSARYIHALYQVMNLAFADRDFYYGDPDRPPAEPRLGLLSKDYAEARRKGIDWTKNDANAKPGDPYPFQNGKNPYLDYLGRWKSDVPVPQASQARSFEEGFLAGTTSIEAADEEGWVVSVTPSGGWNPVCIAGKTGIGMSQRMQSFVLDPAENPYNVLEPGKRPRVTLTPSMALKDGKPFLAFAGPEPAAVLPELRRLRHGRPGGRRGPEHQQLPDAQLLRRARVEAGPDRDQRLDAALRARRAEEDGLPDPHGAEDVGADQRDLLRPRARHDVGRLERLRRRLRRRLVGRPGGLLVSDADGSKSAISNPEGRWPVLVALVGVGLISFSLPHSLVVGPRWLLLALVLALLIPATLAHRAGNHRIDTLFGYVISGVITLALAASLVLLIVRLPSKTESPGSLLGSTTMLWATNVLVFAIWYWRLDAGGPHARRSGRPRRAPSSFPR
jgi:hypothetical protein